MPPGPPKPDRACISGPRIDVLDPAVPRARAQTSIVGIERWRPWMAKAGEPGMLPWDVTRVKRERREQPPAALQVLSLKHDRAVFNQPSEE